MTKKPAGKRAPAPASKKPAAKKAAPAKPAKKVAPATRAPATKNRPAKKAREPKTEPAKTGRPTDFRKEFIEQARKLCTFGATDLELADFFKVHVATIYRWKADNAAFCEAVKVGKKEADDRVERSLFARANGYEHDEVDIRVIGHEVVQTPIRKFYPPDTAACIFWLKNRRKEEWRDKIDHELGGAGGGPLQVVVKRYSDT